MEIAANTKISAILKANPQAIGAIAAINRHFEKLRNPLLRKILASRVTIADAARIGGCSEEEFYIRLEPLGFTHNASIAAQAKPVLTTCERPAFLRQLPPESILTLDVCEDIATGNDPFRKIMDAVAQVKGGNALLLVNSFEPTPLIAILQKRGYTFFAEEVAADLVHTYFWLEKAADRPEAEAEPGEFDFDVLVNEYENKLKYLDVRHLEMPQPMITILGELEMLPTGEALLVTHRKVPRFLLPQLQERSFGFALKETGPKEVYLLIFKETKP